MIVSLYSLRKVYDGNITILYPTRDNEENKYAVKTCKNVAEIFNCSVQEIDMGVPEGKNRVFLERTKYHTITPYDISMSIDSDTVVVDPRIVDYFDAAEENEFALAQFAQWTTNHGVVHKRIQYWMKHYPEEVQAAVDFGPAINCGCFAFRKDAQIIQVWHDKAIVGRESFIADETCMQMLIPYYPIHILPSAYNTSCKYDNKILDEGYPVVIHFHGKKHCRMSDDGQPLHNAEFWLFYFAHCVLDGIFDKLNMDVQLEDYGDNMFGKNQKKVLEYLRAE